MVRREVASGPANDPEAERLIVIGVAPGLKSLSYAVINATEATPRIIDKDVLLGPRGASLVNLARKAYVHELILSVVLERELETFGKAPRPRAILALGPACNQKEEEQNPAHVVAVRIMLTALARRFGLPVVPVRERGMRWALRPGKRESWYSVANRRLSEPLDTDERKLVLAVAIALAGPALYRPKT